MKRYYVKPETIVYFVETEQMLAGSPQDEYSIGGNGSPNEQGGTISDDTGDGPGVSGAKQGSFDMGDF